MSHGFGVRLGGVASIDDLRGRCVVDEDSGCWHLRTARGRPMPTDRRHVVWVFGVGHMTATRASWLLAHPGKSLKKKWVCYRTCDSYDCVAPGHVLSGTRSAWGAHMERSGKAVTIAKTRANSTATPRSTWKLTPQLKQWLLESPQTGVEATHALGITQGRANGIRAKERARVAALPVSSVFALGARGSVTNDAGRRRA